MQISRHVVGNIETNAWIVRSAGETLVIDPGDEDQAFLADALATKPRAVVCTHGHVDHIAGCRPFVTAGVPVMIGAAEAGAFADARLNLSVWVGQPFSLPGCRPVMLAPGETVRVGELEFVVLAVPGHSPGGIALFGHGHVFAGDTLFAASIGRTDLPGGDYEQLAHSIREVLFNLPPETVVHPGHGPDTTIGDEMRDNPFFGAGTR